jgi:pyruvate/2-oxoglutarate dehydrogenase complex dihydrolipoamide dehydrogenase (E3) component
MIDIPGLPRERTLTNESLFDLAKAPKHLVIIGAGVIALEMAFAFQKLGTQVTMFALDPRPLMTAIPEASAAIQAELECKRISTHYNSTAQNFETITYAHDKKGDS